MTTKTVTIRIDPEAGQVWVDEGTLFIGERTPIVLSGYEPEEGATLRMTVFDDDERTPLADNSRDSSVLDMRGDRLRKKFADTKVIGLSAFVVEVGADYSDVIAKGRFTVKWAPFVDDGTGELATLRGPKGDKGDEGHAGPMGPISQIKDPDTGKWYNVLARVDADGNRVVSLEQEDTPPVSGGNVATQGDLDRLGQDIEEELDEVRDGVDDLDGRLMTLGTTVQGISSTVTNINTSAVKKTGDQTIGGVKRFESGIVRDTYYDPENMEGEELPDEIAYPVIKSIDLDGNAMSTVETKVYTASHTVDTIVASTSKDEYGNAVSASVVLDAGPNGSNITFNSDDVTGAPLALAGMPSQTVIEDAMTLPATGSHLTFADGTEFAPYTGWLIFQKTASAAGQLMTLVVREKDASSFGDEYVDIYKATCHVALSGKSALLTVPVPKGCKVYFSYSVEGTTNVLKYMMARAERFVEE